MDFNVRQNHLLELKMAAIAELDHAACLAFLGVHPSSSRAATLRALEVRLSPEARAYWRSEPKAVEEGVLYCGVWERYMRRVKRVLPRQRLLHDMLNAPDLETQRALYARWNNWIWKASMAPMDWRWVWRTVLREPGIEFVPESVSVAGELMRGFERAATERLLRTNPYLNLMFAGGYHDEALPLHLQPAHYETIRANLDRIEIVHAPLTGHLETHPDEYTAFSVSDFASYADPNTYHTAWAAILNAAKDDARVCERFFLVRYRPETLFPGRIVRDPDLERALAERDHTFIYTFNCARIVRPS